MKVALVGGTGFVGTYLTQSLLQAGHEPSLLVRQGSENKVRDADSVRLVTGDIASPAALRSLLEGCDAVIYNVGIIREFPGKGVTYEESQYEGLVRTVTAARETGVDRLLLMSANGVKIPGTGYQETKRRAEQHALDSGLDVTVLRPSVIFGDPLGTMEFATQLYRDMVRPPLPAVGFFKRGDAGQRDIVMSPIHIEDVAAAFMAALDDATTVGKTYDLGGPEVLTWPRMIERIAAATGRNKIVLPMPTWIMRVGATLFDWLPFFPVTRDQLTMVELGNDCSPEPLKALIGREPRAFDEPSLDYLTS